MQFSKANAQQLDDHSFIKLRSAH